MIKAIIVDDEEKARSVLVQMLSRYCPEVIVADSVDSVQAAVESVATHNPNLVFLDVEMPGGDGFELLKKVKNPDFKVIFTTAYGHYAIQAIKISALDYLLKPINAEELKEAVLCFKEETTESDQYVNAYKTLIENLVSDPKKISVPHSRGLSFVNINDIIFCNSDKNYTELVMTGNKKLLSTVILKEYEELFSPLGFIRVHNRYLINIKHVQEYLKGEGGSVIMSDGSEIEVSRRRKAEFMEKLGSLLT